ncbi:MAG: hypothetical protein LH615_10915, partial [Ferruginibacter sp.]|nr:hypothetical protein [Ferruginibacter sp.]
TKQNDDKNILPEKVIALRKAITLGFSLVVQEMCSDMNIPCLSVGGFVKNYAAEINEPMKRITMECSITWAKPRNLLLIDDGIGSEYLDKNLPLLQNSLSAFALLKVKIAVCFAD